MDRLLALIEKYPDKLHHTYLLEEMAETWSDSKCAAFAVVLELVLQADDQGLDPFAFFPAIH